MKKLDWRQIAIVAFLFILADSANSIDNLSSHIARCASLESNSARLQCYDELAESLGLNRPHSTSQRRGQWSVRTEISPIDDSLSVFLGVSSHETIPGRYGREEVRPTLTIRCVENTTALIINWRVFISVGGTRIRYRIDDTRTQSSTWRTSTNHESVGLWNGASSISVIRQMFNRNNFLAEITPYGENPIMVNFDIGGLEEAITPLREACNW